MSVKALTTQTRSSEAFCELQISSKESAVVPASAVAISPKSFNVHVMCTHNFTDGAETLNGGTYSWKRSQKSWNLKRSSER